MKKFTIVPLSLSLLIGFSLAISSCKKEDDPPPVKPKLSFIEPTMTINEADGTVEVEVTLDNPAPEDVVVEYSLAGTARDRATVSANQAYDYEILTEAGEIEIAKGETTGIIEILLTSDYFLEDPETIEITIEDVDNENIEITRDDELAISVEQEDGVGIILAWPAPAGDSAADMDILVRKGTSTTTWEGFVTGSVQESNTGPEFVFIPKTVNDATFGLSYVYYDGDMRRLPFEVIFADFVNGDFEDEAGVQTFEGEYALDNINTWSGETVNSTKVVQTFRKTGGNAVEISSITIPDTGSRIGRTPAIGFLNRQPASADNKTVKRFLEGLTSKSKRGF